MRVIVLKANGPVTQADLDNILQLDAQLETVRDMRDRIAAGVLSRLTAGSEIEPGPRSCRLEETFSGKIRHQRLVVR